MRLEIERISLRRRVFDRYAGALMSSPLPIIDYLVGHIAIASRHLPLSTRYQIAERLRDLGDMIERRDEH